jgi:hypothetical protein
MSKAGFRMQVDLEKRVEEGWEAFQAGIIRVRSRQGGGQMQGSL